MNARIGFAVFKWTAYGLLLLDAVLYLRTEPTLAAFLDSAAWLVLLGVMEYESRRPERDDVGPRERRVLLGLNLFAYSTIVYAWWRYIVEERWLDVANASAWLLVCALLVWRIHAPGALPRRGRQAFAVVKAALYAALVVIAAVWTIEASKPLDAVDAWLWIVCFAVIELNVFGLARRPAPAAAPGAATPGA